MIIKNDCNDVIFIKRDGKSHFEISIHQPSHIDNEYRYIESRIASITINEKEALESINFLENEKPND